MIGMSAQAECVCVIFSPPVPTIGGQPSLRTHSSVVNSSQIGNRGNQSVPFCKLFLNSDEVTL